MFKQNIFLLLIFPGIQFRLPCTPRTIFHGCQIVYWKRSCPQKHFSMGYVKMHGFNEILYDSREWG